MRLSLLSILVLIALGGIARAGEDRELTRVRQGRSLAVADVVVVRCDTTKLGSERETTLEEGPGLLIRLWFSPPNSGLHYYELTIPDARISRGRVRRCTAVMFLCLGGEGAFEVDLGAGLPYTIDSGVLHIDFGQGDRRVPIRGDLRIRLSWCGLDFYRAFGTEASDAGKRASPDLLQRIVLDPAAPLRYRLTAMVRIAAEGTADAVLAAGAALPEARGTWLECCLASLAHAFERLKDDRIRERILAECHRRTGNDLATYGRVLDKTRLRLKSILAMLGGPTRDHALMGVTRLLRLVMREEPLDADARCLLREALLATFLARPDDAILGALIDQVFTYFDR